MLVKILPQPFSQLVPFDLGLVALALELVRCQQLLLQCLGLGPLARILTLKQRVVLERTSLFQDSHELRPAFSHDGLCSVPLP